MTDRLGKEIERGDWVETNSADGKPTRLVYGFITDIFVDDRSVKIKTINYLDDNTVLINRWTHELRKLSETETFLKKLECSYDR